VSDFEKINIEMVVGKPNITVNLRLTVKSIKVALRIAASCAITSITAEQLEIC